jgi:hypothetical protein
LREPDFESGASAIPPLRRPLPERFFFEFLLTFLFADNRFDNQLSPNEVAACANRQLVARYNLPSFRNAVTADKPHPTSSAAKGKTRKVVSDNQSQKPYPAFPLTAHKTGRGCKKLKTRHGWKSFDFGPLANRQGALDRYKAEVADLMAGRTPTARNKDGLRLLELLNHFLHAKRGKIATGELTMRSWYDLSPGRSAAAQGVR